MFGTGSYTQSQNLNQSTNMPGPLAIPLITAGAGILGNVLGGLFGNKGRKRETNRARAHDINMWEMTNTYNDPVNQMKRLKSAGLNPNMVYGGSSGQTAGTASSLPGAKPAGVETIDPSNELMSYVGLKNTEAQTDNIHAQKAVNDSLATLNRFKGITETAKAANLDSEAQYKAAMTKLTGQQLINAAKDENLKNLEIDDWNKGIKGNSNTQQLLRFINKNDSTIGEIMNLMNVMNMDPTTRANIFQKIATKIAKRNQG